MSYVTRQVSHVFIFIYVYFVIGKVVDLVSEGSVINGAYPAYFFFKKTVFTHTNTFQCWFVITPR